MIDSEIYLLDEPTTGMDVAIKNFLFEEILAMKDRGKTVLFTTQQLEEVERICSHVAILHNGKIISSGLIDDVKDELSGMITMYIKLQDEEEKDAIMIKNIVLDELKNEKIEMKNNRELLEFTINDKTANLIRLMGKISCHCKIAECGIRKANLEEIIMSLSQGED